MTCRLSLPIFGLAVYKFKNSDWTQSGLHGIKKVSSLMNSTENWLRSLNVYHPDFCVFEEPRLLEVKGGEEEDKGIYVFLCERCGIGHFSERGSGFICRDGEEEKEAMEV
ncbi:hypothetical protein CTI12_AA331680 [Artemisia annua]|uniref:Uncharacterized protein n=1 Tax=Artemisia annua TaxID=35608 RepID=A0A2U1MX75_ARTAN|nr:hypothetical protein CTI12_AA331680 [Artemisia annua]